MYLHLAKLEGYCKLHMFLSPDFQLLFKGLHQLEFKTELKTEFNYFGSCSKRLRAVSYKRCSGSQGQSSARRRWNSKDCIVVNVQQMYREDRIFLPGVFLQLCLLTFPEWRPGHVTSRESPDPHSLHPHWGRRLKGCSREWFMFAAEREEDTISSYVTCGISINLQNFA